MIALLLAGAAAALVVAAIVLLRRMGDRWRTGRLLAAAPSRTLQQASEMVVRGDQAYVRVSGRIASDEEFPDEHDNPLVFRRRRLQREDAGRWTTIDDQRDAVPFWLEERGVRVAIDVEALAEGLVVVPRFAEGVASELEPGLHPRLADVPPDTRLRLRVDQLSAVEHASGCGVVAPGPDGTPRMTAGLGRPLLVTPLEPAVAMRVLASESRTSVLAVTALLVIAAISATGAVVAFLAGR